MRNLEKQSRAAWFFFLCAYSVRQTQQYSYWDSYALHTQGYIFVRCIYRDGMTWLKYEKELWRLAVARAITSVWVEKFFIAEWQIFSQIENIKLNIWRRFETWVTMSNLCCFQTGTNDKRVKITGWLDLRLFFTITLSIQLKNTNNYYKSARTI